MSRDPEASDFPQRPSIRVAVLELAASGQIEDEAQFLSALRQIVAHGRSRADDLWEIYHGGTPDARAHLFARFAD